MIVGGVFAFLRFPVPKNEFKRDFVRGFPYRCALSLRGKPPSNGGESLGKKWSGCWWWGGTFLTASIFDWWFQFLFSYLLGWIPIIEFLVVGLRVSEKDQPRTKKNSFFQFPGYLDLNFQGIWIYTTVKVKASSTLSCPKGKNMSQTRSSTAPGKSWLNVVSPEPIMGGSSLVPREKPWKTLSIGCWGHPLFGGVFVDPYSGFF